MKYYLEGLVAQWSRARVSEARCRGFNSLLAQKYKQKKNI